MASSQRVSGLEWVRGLVLFLVPCAVFMVVSIAHGAGEESRAQPDQTRAQGSRRFEHALARVQPLLDRYGYGAAVGAAMLEGVGIPAPGQTLLMAAALEASKGRRNIVVLVIWVAAAAAAGNSIGYAAGRWG